jgi:hypothetical protein
VCLRRLPNTAMWIINWCKLFLYLLRLARYRVMAYPLLEMHIREKPLLDNIGLRGYLTQHTAVLTLTAPSLRRPGLAWPAQQAREAAVPRSRQCRKDDAATHAQERPRRDPPADAAP